MINAMVYAKIYAEGFVARAKDWMKGPQKKKREKRKRKKRGRGKGTSADRILAIALLVDDGDGKRNKPKPMKRNRHTVPSMLGWAGAKSKTTSRRECLARTQPLGTGQRRHLHFGTTYDGRHMPTVGRRLGAGVSNRAKPLAVFLAGCRRRAAVCACLLTALCCAVWCGVVWWYRT